MLEPEKIWAEPQKNGIVDSELLLHLQTSH